MNDLSSLIQFRNNGDYQRENFDAFLKSVSFSYSIPSIHVAGTNGKGSTCNYISSIYIEEGYKVGTFTSPSLISFNHDIKINNIPISDEDISSIVNKFKDNIERYQLSAFEIQTFIALTYFNQMKCDIAVIECGMGGLTDATNIFNPILSIITSVSLEHTSYLGRTLCEITLNKLGITRENGKLLIGNLNNECLDTILPYCKDNRINLYRLSESFNIRHQNGITFDYLTYNNLRIKSNAKYSIYDACLAVETVKILDGTFSVKDDNVYSGLAKTFNELRFEQVSENPKIILDGAHNPEAMIKLKDSVNIFENSAIHTLFACFKDKNLMMLLSTSSEFSSSLTITTFNHPRARTYDDYFLFANEYEYKENPIEALNELIEKYPNDIILVTGSLAFVSYIKKTIEEGKVNVSKK